MKANRSLVPLLIALLFMLAAVLWCIVGYFTQTTLTGAPRVQHDTAFSFSEKLEAGESLYYQYLDAPLMTWWTCRVQYVQQQGAACLVTVHTWTGWDWYPSSACLVNAKAPGDVYAETSYSPRISFTDGGVLVSSTAKTKRLVSYQFIPFLTSDNRSNP